MSKIVEIKQTANLFARSLSLKDRTTSPNSFRFFQVKKKEDGTWNTGLTEEDRARLEKKTGENLADTSEYWENLIIDLVVGNEETRKFNLVRATEEIKYKAALANKFVAPSFDMIGEKGYYDCFLYVFEPAVEANKKQKLQELKDEATSLIYGMRSNKDKMFFLANYLSIPVNSEMSPQVLYLLLTNKKDSLKNFDEYSKFIDSLKKDPIELQIQVIVKQAILKKLIKYVNGMFTWADMPIGDSEVNVIKYFTKEENIEHFVLLKEQTGL